MTYGYRETGNQDLQGYYGALVSNPRQKLAPEKSSGVGDIGKNKVKVENKQVGKKN